MHTVERYQQNSWRNSTKVKPRRINFARAVYCAGVNIWYVRLGSQQGIDIMYPEPNEDVARSHARLINQSLKRYLKSR